MTETVGQGWLHGRVSTTVPSFTLRPPRIVRQARFAPTAAQRRVIEHASGALLVLGGPGTGKTEVIAAAAAARSSAEGPRPLVFCFSSRSAARMRDKVAHAVGGAIPSPMAVTFHAFCLALVLRFAEQGAEAPRLLSAPEQEARMRELLGGTPPTQWPDELRLAIRTRGFAAELRGFLARCRQLGLDPVDVVRAGRAADVEEWVAAGGFFEEYLDVLDAEGAVDYAELVHRARLLMTRPDVAAALAREIGTVYVDELQELDASQLGLLRQLVPVRGHVVACADPDQAVYGFRGAHRRGLAEFVRLFSEDSEPMVGGSDGTLGGPTGATRIEVLADSFRLPVRIRSAAAAIAERLPLPGLPGGALADLRRLGGTDTTGTIRVHTLDAPSDEALFIARELRRMHLVEGVPWSEMAVVVRSSRRFIPGLRRTLSGAGVPVEVAGDEIPLASELAVRPLLLALGVVCGRSVLDADVAQRLLASPLAGLDATRLRGLGRALRMAERTEFAGELPRSSAELIAAALDEPDRLADLPPDVVPEEAVRLAMLIASARALVSTGASAVEVLWHIWQGTPWPAALQADVAAGGARARRADRDLDAVCALFDIAERSDAFVGDRGVTVFLDEVAAQSIPADTLREGRVRGDAVRILTAYRAKGLQWRRVFVAGVQEGVWPDFRSLDPLLHASSLPDAPAGPDRHEAIAAARRLFYVAITRASEELVITAVSGTDGEADEPSRFLREVGVSAEPITDPGSPALSLSDVVVSLRRAVVDPASSDGLRRAAAARLARMADLGERAADPATWWGTAQISSRFASGGDNVRLSGSQLGSLLSCPRQYFLSREAHADTARTSAAGLGSVIHALAQHALSDGLSPDDMAGELDQVWDRIGFDAAWLSVSERVEAEHALQRLTNWTAAHDYRQVVGVEVPFHAEVDIDGVKVALVGAVDRLELDGEGGLRIVDFKTGRRAPTQAEVASHDQLGVYQLAVTLGAFDAVAPGVRRAGGGELVLLRIPTENADYPKHVQQTSLTDHPHPPGVEAASPTWVHERLGEAVRIVREGSFPATPGDDVCRYCPFTSSCPARGGRQVVS
jgi:superfamily I DNA/RNA helicase/RecB family exonuclease